MDHDQDSGERFDEVELLEDHTQRIRGGAVRHGRRFGVSVPGAVAGVFLVTALAFGAGLRPSLPTSSTGGSDRTAAGDPAATDDTTAGGTTAYGHADYGHAGDGSTDGDHPGGEGDLGTETSGDANGQTEQGEETGDGSEPEPQPVHDVVHLDLSLSLDGLAVVVDWSGCDPDGFLGYEVIRSTNEAATWPLGEGDTLLGVIEGAGTTRFVDTHPLAGKKAWYRVVARAEVDGPSFVACSTDTKKIVAAKPAPKPDPEALALTVGIKEGHPFLDWAACEGIDFDYYKVVRSTDSTVTWPTGDNDSFIAAIGADGDTKLFDGDAPGGKKLWYRVFCVRSTDAGYVAVRSSAAKAVETPVVEPQPIPDPKDLGFEIDVTDGGVVLHWEACGAESFRYYKIVRSMTNDNPLYPLNDGTQLIGVIENSAVTEFTDSDVASGQTWHYRVLSVGYIGDQKVILGITAVKTVAIP